MQDKNTIRKDLIAPFEGLIDQGGKPIEKSEHFADYVNIGVCLSKGLREPQIKAALLGLEEAMITRIKKSVVQAKGAEVHFQEIEKHYTEGKQTAAPKDKDYSKLLSGSLDAFEKQHGFVVVGERLPNYVGFAGGAVFKEALSQGQHWKDVGAGDDHGEYTHRLQWYLVISAGVIKTAPTNQEATVYKSIAKWQRGVNEDTGVQRRLWSLLFDLGRSDKKIGEDNLDFRSPENLNLWLTGNEDPTFCPVLRSFLRARKAKRGENIFDVASYLQKKLKWSAEQSSEYLLWENRVRSKRYPSQRIIFPKGEKPVLSPYVNETYKKF